MSARVPDRIDAIAQLEVRRELDIICYNVEDRHSNMIPPLQRQRSQMPCRSAESVPGISHEFAFGVFASVKGDDRVLAFGCILVPQPYLGGLDRCFAHLEKE